MSKRKSSAEYRAFQKCFADLAEAAVSGVKSGWLALELFSNGLIGDELLTETQKQGIEERVKVVKLLSAVKDQISASPTTKFREFLDVLQNEPSLQHLAIRLENTHCEFVSMPPPTSTPSSPLDTYESYLKSVYTRKKLPIYDRCPLVKSKKYINLALIEKENVTKQEADQFIRETIHGNIDDIRTSKRDTKINQIAQLPDGSRPKCILVEGAPGIGKSTFAWKLCRKWRKEKLLWQYRLVVLLNLRDKRVRAAKNISDLFRYHDYQIQQAAVEEIQRKEGKGVLLLFEGYDELPDELRTENSVFLDVITGRDLPEATVLITSRPWASEFLHRKCKGRISQHIEILGFTKDNIQSYLESTTANDPSLLEGLKKYISCYPHIGGLMYIPLNSAIVVEVYRNSRNEMEGKTQVVPRTMTELYSSLIRILLLRHLFDHPVHGKKRWRVRSFSDLPQDVLDQLCEVGRIAYKGILNKQQVIFSDCDLPKDFETLGLMHCVPELYPDEGAAVSYNFLHLTVQEYLAAYYLSRQEVEEQKKHFTEKDTCRHLHMVLRFLSGLKKFEGYLNDVLNTLCVKKSDSGNIYKVTFDNLHWLFEAQITDKMHEPSNIKLHTPDTPYQQVVTPSDCFVMGYCISHSNCTWRINLNYGLVGCHIGDEGVEMLVRGALEEKTDCMGRFSVIDLFNSDITTKGVEHLSRLPPKLILGLEALYLGHNNSSKESYQAISNLLHSVPNLKRLSLSYLHKIEQGEAVQLITPLKGLKSLEMLVLHITGFGKEVCQALSELLSSSTSLKWLDITNLDIEGTQALSLKAEELKLGARNIDSEGAHQLASALCTNDTLQELKLRSNSIGFNGATEFAEMLCKNKSLKKLFLQDNSIGEEGTRALIDSLTKNTKLEELWLPKTYQPFIASSGVDSRVKWGDDKIHPSHLLNPNASPSKSSLPLTTCTHSNPISSPSLPTSSPHLQHPQSSSMDAYSHLPLPPDQEPGTELYTWEMQRGKSKQELIECRTSSISTCEFQFKDVQDAAQHIRGEVVETPLEKSKRLSEMLKMNIYLKKDFLMEGARSFKARGACNTLKQLAPEQKQRGVITASAGNHALALAYYGMKLGVPVTVVLPTTAPYIKVSRCREYSTNIIRHGQNIGEAEKLATRKAEEEGLQYVNGYNDLPLLAGQGVAALEVLEQMKELGVVPDAIVIPVGGGGLLAGMTTVIEHLTPHIKIIAVESETCPSFTEALKAGKPVKVQMDPATLADGLNVPIVGRNAFEIVRQCTNNFEKLRVEVVKEEHIKQGILMLEKEEMKVEGGGAITLAACMYNLREQLWGKNVVLMLSSGNIDPSILEHLKKEQPMDQKSTVPKPSVITEVDNEYTKEKEFPAKETLAPEPDERESENSTRGVEVIKETEISFLEQGGTFEWRGYGLRLHVPKGSLPHGMEECRINIKASLSGQFQLPQDSDLLSPVFWITAPCKFTKPVTLEVQHCALTEDEAALSHLSFVSANCTQRDLPYRFKPVAGGVFSRHSSYGSIQLSHFSGIGIIERILGTQRSYCAHLYHTKNQLYDWRFYFVITQDLDANNTFVGEYYNSRFARREATLRVIFTDSKITLKIPEDGLVTGDGWRITPFSCPTILREDADQFKMGQWIPECQLIVQWEKEDQRPVRLRHRVDLIGAKPPYNFINLTLNPAVTPDVGDLSGIDSTPLNVDDLQNVRSAVISLAGRWKDLGISLGVHINDLDEIISANPHSPRDCLREMLTKWLRQNYNVERFGEPTWRRLVEAVKDDVGGNNPALAQTIARKHSGSQ